jgi:hypothetical protein
MLEALKTPWLGTADDNQKALLVPAHVDSGTG